MSIRNSFTFGSEFCDVCGLFLLAVILRIAVAISLPLAPLTPDYQEYLHLAGRLSDSGAYGFDNTWQNDPDLAKSMWRFLYDEHGTVRPPGYPAFLALVHLILGDNAKILQFIFSLISGLTAILIYKSGKLLFNRWGGIIAAVLYAASPGDLYAISWLGREPLLNFFIIAGLYLMLRLQQEPNLKYAILAGICFGLGGYFKETVAFFGLICAAWLILTGLRRKSRLVPSSILVVLCISAVLLPWIARNSLCYRRVMGISTMSGLNMWLGLVDTKWDNALHDIRIEEYIPAEERQRVDPYQAVYGYDADHRLQTAVYIYTSDHPLQVISSALWNMVFFWSPMSKTVSIFGFNKRPLEVISLVFYVGVFFSALVGILANIRNREVHLVFATLIAVTLVHGMFCSYPRYRIPFETVVFLCSAAGIEVLFMLLRRPLCSSNTDSVPM